MHGAWAECTVFPTATTARRCAVMSIFSTCICDRFCRALEKLFRFVQSRRVRLKLSLAMSSSSIASTRPLSRVLHWVMLAAALSFSSCRLSGGLPMDRESEQPAHATDSASSTTSSLGSHVDDSARLWWHPGLTSTAELAAAPSSAGSVGTASFTDDLTLLEPCKDQMCGEITIAPGTVRRIPYVIPSGWHYANNQVHLVEEMPELRYLDSELFGLDYHVEWLSAGFSFRGIPHRGLLLCASVPLTYRRRRRRTYGYKVKPITRPLKLELEVHLVPAASSASREPFSRSMRLGYVSIIGRALTVSIPLSDAHLPSIAFGAAAWQEYFGVDVGKEPELPNSIEEILNCTAPFLLDGESAHQRIRDNHLLTLIPSRISEEGFTLDELGALLLRNHNNHFEAFQSNDEERPGECSHGYRYYSEFLKDATRHTLLPGTSYWVLLPKTILRGSRGKSFSEQKKMIAEYSGAGYQLPCVLEVAASLLAHYARSNGERLYANENPRGWWTYTSCSDVDKDGYPIAVGGFGSSGLSVRRDCRMMGVACLQEL